MIDSGIRAVFFDAVGTFLFPRLPVSRTYAEYADRHGASLPEDQVRSAFRMAFARQEEVDRAAGWRTDEARERARWRAIVAEVLPVGDPEACFAGLWDWFSRPAAWTVPAEAGEVLGELARRDIVVGVGSNFDSRLLPIVDALPELAPVRGRVVVSSLVGWRKPAPQFFDALVRAAGCDRGQLVFVGDDERNDLHGAAAAGLRAVLLDPMAQIPRPNHVRRLRDLIAG